MLATLQPHGGSLWLTMLVASFFLPLLFTLWKRNRWQYSLRGIFAAVAVVAILLLLLGPDAQSLKLEVLAHVYALRYNLIGELAWVGAPAVLLFTASVFLSRRIIAQRHRTRLKATGANSEMGVQPAIPPERNSSGVER
jgi:hypothetical protein